MWFCEVGLGWEFNEVVGEESVGEGGVILAEVEGAIDVREEAMGGESDEESGRLDSEMPCGVITRDDDETGDAKG